MSDFYQGRIIATLHRLGEPTREKIEDELRKYTRVRPIALVLPITPQDMRADPFPKICDDLKKADYIKRIIVTLGKSDEKKDYAELMDKVTGLPQEVTVIWASGGKIRSFLDIVEESGLSIGADGKGRSVWLASGYILSCNDCKVIAGHDCDIVNYDREMLARLAYPVTNPNLEYEFCKGYYSRVRERMYGRVTRLFVTPIVHSLMTLIGEHRFLVYVDSFRYPLAGEFSMDRGLAQLNRVSGDWGLEVGTLAEMYRNCALARICQVDICANYEHKHQPLSAEDARTGLLKMSIDIAKVLFRTLASQGVIFSDGFFKSLVACYIRTAQDAIRQYRADALINGLKFDQHEEATAVEAFTRGIAIASSTFLEDPMGIPQIPNWNRVISAVPGALDALRETIESKQL